MTDENTIRIYTADVTPLNDSILFDRIYDSVSPYRRNKTDEKKLMKDRILSLGVEFLLMTACMDAGIEYSEMIYGENGYGKPFFENCPLCFSLSHSGERAMCVTAPQPVGCDTERIRNVSPQVAARHFSLKENNLLGTCVNTDERNDLFFIGGEAWMTERVFRLLKTERVSALESWPSKMTMTIIDHD